MVHAVAAAAKEVKVVAEAVAKVSFLQISDCADEIRDHLIG